MAIATAAAATERSATTLIGLGGYHVGKVAVEADSTRLIRTAIDRGITFMDNCWDYNHG